MHVPGYPLLACQKQTTFHLTCRCIPGNPYPTSTVYTYISCASYCFEWLTALLSQLTSQPPENPWRLLPGLLVCELWQKCQNQIPGLRTTPRCATPGKPPCAVIRIKTEDVTKTKGNDFEDYFLSKELLLGSKHEEPWWTGVGTTHLPVPSSF